MPRKLDGHRAGDGDARSADARPRVFSEQTFFERQAGIEAAYLPTETHRTATRQSATTSDSTTRSST
jgi:hypothetical protein